MKRTFVKTMIDISIGAVIGGIIGVLYTKNYYDHKDDGEIEKIREMYKQKYETANKKEIEQKKPEETYEKIACEYHNPEKPIPKKNYNIKVIRPDEFGEDFSYDNVSLIYYADNVLAYDDNDEMITDIDGTVGEENLKRLKSYNDDALYIKNDILKIYYEIVPSEKTYAEMTGFPDSY